jgi:hypothetical protein
MPAISATIALILLASASAQNELFCNSVLDEAILTTDKCVLKEYKQQDVTECLNLLSKHRTSTNQSNVIYFVGDSRIRQQFFSFLKVKLKYVVERENYLNLVK